jgi:hypothetical protein
MMKSRYQIPYKDRCESWSCEGKHSRCENDGVLCAVYGLGINIQDRQEYYYCPKAIEIDKEQGYTVVELKDD